MTHKLWVSVRSAEWNSVWTMGVGGGLVMLSA
jgi:hypothetical protein